MSSGEKRMSADDEKIVDDCPLPYVESHRNVQPVKLERYDDPSIRKTHCFRNYIPDKYFCFSPT